MEIYLLIFLIALIIPICASVYCNSTYSKYRKIRVKTDVTGQEVARKILDKNGMKDVYVVTVNGKMTDHYDPRRKVVRLSQEVFEKNTVASVAIAAHEVGHAIQDKKGYVFMKIRQFIFPIVDLSSKIAYVVLIVGFISSIVNLIWLGIILVAFGVLFQIVTLPVELDASKRAKEELNKLNILTTNELSETETMLTSAALTYVAGLVSSLLELLRLILLARNN